MSITGLGNSTSIFIAGWQTAHVRESRWRAWQLMKPLLIVLLLLPVMAFGYTFSQPKCWPEEKIPNGAGKGFQTWDPQDGTGLCRGGWWCPLPDGKWESYTHCTIAKYKDASWQLFWQQASSLPAQDAAALMLNSLQIAPSTPEEIAAMDGLQNRFAQRMLSTRPADVVVAPAWVVDVGTDSTKTTRPAYPFVNGVRGTTSTGRATSGQPCKPEVAQAPSGTPGTVYAAFGPSFSSSLVALCRKQ